MRRTKNLQVRPPTGWKSVGPIHVAVWNALLDHGLTIHDADTMVGAISHALPSAVPSPEAIAMLVAEMNESATRDSGACYGPLAYFAQRLGKLNGLTGQP